MAQPVSSGTRRVTRKAQSAGTRQQSPKKAADTGKRTRTFNAEQAKKKIKKRKGLIAVGELDYTLLFFIVLIVAIGLIAMLSASAPSGNRIYDNSYYFFKRQLFFIIVGLVGMIAVSRINLDNILHLIPAAFWVCVALLVLVLIPGIGVKVNGARRWMDIFSIQIQPSELMKPVIAMYIAYLIKIGKVDLTTFKGIRRCGGIIGLVALLLMLETHLSGTIVIVGIALCVMIAGGMPIRPVIILGIIGIVFVAVYLHFDSMRMARVTALIDPFADARGTGYQISQSIYAIGSGRIFGLGLGQSVQKYSNLPEPYNDFIFAIVCEELGFFGAVIIILLFAAMFLKAMRIAMAAPDVWSSLTCVGIASQIGIQTFFNMGVAVSLIPNTGVSLPFFSYGGTSIMTLLLEMGILLNVSRRCVKE